ncbi:MAG: DUF5041 domain-containing protein [Bacteroides sp.]|nr:DUF5041 domain-containing protein [Bacteroides sp.]
MKRFQFLVLALFMAVSVFSQNIKSQKATMDDYLPLLNATGYKVYSFDITEFLNDTYNFKFSIKEYVNREEVPGNNRFSMFSNRMMLNDFPEESQKRILEEGRAADPEKGVYMQAKKLTIGFMPATSDSLRRVNLEMDGMGSSGRQLTLKSLTDPKTGKKFYHYESRPFIVDKFEEGKFIPLVFFASCWVDKVYGFFRFCGAMEIGPNMEADYVENTPHYYVIGVEINKAK